MGFLTCEKNGIRLLIGHAIFFTGQKNRMTNEIASYQRYYFCSVSSRYYIISLDTVFCEIG